VAEPKQEATPWPNYDLATALLPPPEKCPFNPCFSCFAVFVRGASFVAPGGSAPFALNATEGAKRASSTAGGCGAGFPFGRWAKGC